MAGVLSCRASECQTSQSERNRTFTGSGRLVSHSAVLYLGIYYLLLLQLLPTVAAESQLLKRQFSASLYQSSRLQREKSAPVSLRSAAYCHVKCKTTKERPFCASDGKTYTSKCELRRVIKCEEKELKVVSKGRCKDGAVVPRCEEKRRELERSKSEGVSIPTCEADGSYTPVQCYQATGYCWCVTPEGKPLPRTSVKGKRPNCNEDEGKPSSKKRRGASKKKCGRKDRATFTSNLVQLFAGDYSRIPASLSQEQDGDQNIDVVAWKYDQLDSNKDGFLKKDEIKSLRKLTRRQVKPKVCAKRFPKYCDKNQDSVIDKEEWSGCLGDGVNNDKVTSPVVVPPPSSAHSHQRDDAEEADAEEAVGGARRPEKSRDGGIDFPPQFSSSATRDNHQSALSFLALLGAKRRTGPSLIDKQPGQDLLVTESRPDMPETQPSSVVDCFEARRQEEENEKTYPNGQIFVPECVDGGLYKKDQCHKYTGYCWCVDERTGKPIPGYSTRNQVPDCSLAKPQREIKGCSYPEKRQFLTEMLDSLSRQMVDFHKEHPNSKDITLDPNGSFEETAIRWKFKMLDTNANKQLDRKETKNLKDLFKVSVQSQGQKSLRKCARNFLRYCDEDNNGKLTEAEWLECLTLNDIPKDDLGHKKRKGKNPLTEYLKS